MISETNLIKDVTQLQNEYYKNDPKNMFFKKNQKLDCAKHIESQFDLNDLIAETVYIIPNTNKIFVDYMILKLYANPDNYEIIINHMFELYNYCIEYYGNFEININLNSFSISAVERYKSVIKIFSDKCITKNRDYSLNIVQMKIYNTPFMIDSISKLIKPFIDYRIYDKIVMYSKEESVHLLRELFK